MKFDFSIYSTGSLENLLKSFKTAEALGADICWTDDARLGRDPFVVLTLAALSTKRVKLGTAVVNPLSRHIANSMRAIATLDEISGGRAILGIGRGESALLPLNLPVISSSEFEDSISLLKSLLSGETMREGKGIFTLNNAKLEVPTKSRVPIYVAATGPKVLRIAGRLADGALVSVGANPNCIKDAFHRIKEGAEQSKRNPTDVDVAIFLFSCIFDNTEEAMNAARPLSAWLLAKNPYLGRIAGLSESDVNGVKTALKGIRSMSEALSKAQQMKDLVSDRVVDSFTIAGKPTDCIEKVRAIRDEGIEHLNWLIKSNWDYAARSVAETIMPSN